MSNTAPPPHHLARPGTKVTAVRTEQFDFPSRQQGTQSAPPQRPSANPNEMTIPVPGPRSASGAGIPVNLPPGHPAAQRIAQLAQEAQQAQVQPEPVQAAPVDSDDAPLQAESDPSFYSVGLPSLGKFYRGALSARFIKGVHQAKFSRAAKEDNLRYLVEAISATVGDGRSAFDLTPPDFYFLMHWQRIASFPKNPQVVTYTCTNVDHVAATLLRKDLPEYKAPETLEISTFLDKTTVDITFLEELDLTPWTQLIEKYDLYVETMRDLVDFNDLQDDVRAERMRVALAKAKATGKDPNTPDYEELADNAISDDELLWLTTKASFLRRTEGRKTLQQRMDIVRGMPADDIMSLEEYIDAVTSYGVKEFANLTCKECGAHHRVPISVDALSFLP